MTSNASLFPHHQKPSKAKTHTTSTSLAFTSTLTSLLSSSSPSSTSLTKPGRPRPSRQKEDIFHSHNRNTLKRAAKDLEDASDDTTRYAEQKHKQGREIGGVDPGMLKRSRRKLEEKARLYGRLKRGEEGDGEGDGEGEGLVDFDRKWAEAGSDDDDDDDDGDGEGQEQDNTLIEYEDEYGRLLHGTRAEASRMERRKNSALRGQADLSHLSARPSMPSTLIHGDAIQTEAFAPTETVYEKMEALARKRDRSATPPEMKHYEADKEVRSKGVGFFVFSRDEGVREEEMKALEREREETERVRGERERKKGERRKEMLERRRIVGEKRARKQADAFLEGLGGEEETAAEGEEGK